MTTLTTVANKFEEELYIVDEVTYNSDPSSAAAGFGSGDSVDTINKEAGKTRNSKIDEAINGTRSNLARILQRNEGTFSFEVPLRPSGTAGTAPGEDLLLGSALGVSSNVPATSQTYTPDASRKSLAAYIKRGFFGEFFTGLVVDSWKLTIDGENEAMWTFEGPLADGRRAGADTVAGGGVTSDATTLTVTNGLNYEANTQILLASEIMQVTSVSGNDLTVVRGFAGTTNVTHASDVAVGPLDPTFVSTGTSIVGPVTITFDTGSGAVTFDVMSIEISGAEAVKMFNDETQTTFATGFTKNRRSYTAAVEMRLYSDQFHILQSFTQQDGFTVIITIGETAGRIVTITSATTVVEGEIEGIPFNDDEQVVPLNLVFLASAGDDELSIAYT